VQWRLLLNSWLASRLPLAQLKTRTHLFINKKAYSLFRQRIKPVKLTRTQAWRRKNKKGKIEGASKKRRAKVQKFQKAIVGMSLDDLKRRKGQKVAIF